MSSPDGAKRNPGDVRVVPDVANAHPGYLLSVACRRQPWAKKSALDRTIFWQAPRGSVRDLINDTATGPVNVMPIAAYQAGFGCPVGLASPGATKYMKVVD
jgi:hypothetical protein